MSILMILFHELSVQVKVTPWMYRIFLWTCSVVYGTGSVVYKMGYCL